MTGHTKSCAWNQYSIDIKCNPLTMLYLLRKFIWQYLCQAQQHCSPCVGVRGHRGDPGAVGRAWGRPSRGRCDLTDFGYHPAKINIGSWYDGLNACYKDTSYSHSVITWYEIDNQCIWEIKSLRKLIILNILEQLKFS